MNAHHTSAKHKVTSRNSFGYESQVFGLGAEAVEFEMDKEVGTWKVGPPVQGARFSRGFLRGLSAWLDAYAAPSFPSQQQQQQQQNVQQVAAGMAGLSIGAASADPYSVQQPSGAPPAASGAALVRLSVRLEQMELTDTEARF